MQSFVSACCADLNVQLWDQADLSVPSRNELFSFPRRTETSAGPAAQLQLSLWTSFFSAVLLYSFLLFFHFSTLVQSTYLVFWWILRCNINYKPSTIRGLKMRPACSINSALQHHEICTDDYAGLLGPVDRIFQPYFPLCLCLHSGRFYFTKVRHVHTPCIREKRRKKAAVVVMV